MSARAVHLIRKGGRGAAQTRREPGHLCGSCGQPIAGSVGGYLTMAQAGVRLGYTGRRPGESARRLFALHRVRLLRRSGRAWVISPATLDAFMASRAVGGDVSLIQR